MMIQALRSRSRHSGTLCEVRCSLLVAALVCSVVVLCPPKAHCRDNNGRPATLLFAFPAGRATSSREADASPTAYTIITILERCHHR